MYDHWEIVGTATDAWLPVRLVDDVDLVTGEPGKAYDDLTVKYLAEGATGAGTAYSVTAADWKEGSDGDYWLNIGAGEFVSYGLYRVTVACSGCWTYACIVRVVKGVEAECGDALDTYDPPTKTELDSALAALNDLSSAEAQAAANAALVALWLDHLLAVSLGGAKPVAGTMLDLMTSKDSNQTYNRVTDSLEALSEAAAESGGGAGGTGSGTIDADSPKKASGDSGSVEQFSVAEKIRADQYNASKTAMGKRSKGLRFVKVQNDDE